MYKENAIRKTWPWFVLLGVLFVFNILYPMKITAAAAQASGEAVIPQPTESVGISCLIEGNEVVISGGVSGDRSDPAYYDNYLYLFELQPYQDSISGRTDYSGWITKGEELSFRLPLNYGTSEDRLFSKFVIAVYNGTEYLPISNATYITNPEVLAKNTDAFRAPLSKKGLLIEQSLLNDAFELGVKHVIVNIPFHHILGEGIDYTYDGKTYHFNKALMDEYDNTIRRMSEKGMLVTAVILNGWNDNTPQLIHPNAQKSATANYYAFNAATKEGYETIKAIASFLAERYGSHSSVHGKVSNWIIGNEINNNKVWNYSGPMDIEQYVKEYERAFRVFYTAIKSTSRNDRVYFSTDYNWNNEQELEANLRYRAKDVVDVFNRIVTAGGQMEWGLAYHPYSIPLTEPEFWDDDQTGLISQDYNSPVINFANLHVLTDYFQEAALRAPGNEVRHIILSEQGFTSRSITRGDNYELQAAAFAYAYYIADSNPYIDSFIMSRQVDAVIEANESMAFGLWHCDMTSPNIVKETTRKKIWATFKAIDGRNSLEATEFAKGVIGIQKWSDVIPNFNRREE